MILVRFSFLFLCWTASCHLCLIDPIQRGGLPEILEPGDDACLQTRMCGKESGKTYTEYTKGTEIEVTYQKNINKYNPKDVGVFQIWFAQHPGSEMQLMGMYPDDDTPDLTDYTRKITLPDKTSEDAVIMVEYDPHDGSNLVFYQCSDIQITGGEGDDICLPRTYEVHVEVLRDVIHGDSHHHDEFNEGDFLHMWVDGDAQKTLVHAFDQERSQRQVDEHHIFLLRDYNQGLQWRGHWNRTTKTVTHCSLSFHTGKLEPYCLAYKPTYEGTGSLGEKNKVDYWNTTFDNPDKRVHEEIHIMTEKGSRSIPIVEEVKGTKEPDVHWMEHREFYDLSEAKIDPTVFYIPDSCPH